MPALAAVAIALLAVALGGGAAAGSERAAASADRRPNVVVIMTDDQTVEQMRALPNVRRLIGGRGTSFERNYASYPLCCPSRATYLTGQYSHNHGVRGNSAPIGGFYRLDSSNTLPVWMSRAGYRTAHIGKYLNDYGRRDPRQVPAGWQSWHASIDPSTYFYFGYTLNENGRLRIYGLGERDYQADVYTRKAVDYIRARAPSRQPFFLSVAYLVPHAGGPDRLFDRCRGSAHPAPRHSGRHDRTALPAPPGFNEADVSDKPATIRAVGPIGAAGRDAIERDYRCRRESLLAVDEGAREILEALNASGELRNTVVIFTSDNGFFQGEHRIRSGKARVYEEVSRVPLMIRGPGVPRRRRVTGLTANIDLARTIARVAHARSGRLLDGISLISAARRPRGLRRRELLIENGPGADGLHFTAIRVPGYVYAEYDNGDRELYDMARDPFQLESRHGDPAYAAIRARLAARLAALRTCAGASCRR